MEYQDLASNNLFKGDSYDTPEGKRSFFNKLVLGSRVDFYVRNFAVFQQSGACAGRGELDGFNQIKYSNMNVDVVEKCGGKIHLRGLDKVRAVNHAPVVVIGNHMSLLETALLHAVIRAHIDFSFVIKESLLKIPYFGNILRALDAVAVGRSDPREDFKLVMSEGTRILNSGRSIIIFPQSTRSVEFNVDQFNSIGVKLARSAGVQVLPMALKTDFVPTGKLVRDLGPVNRKHEIWFEFGDAITIEGNGKAQHNEIAQFIKSRLDEWNAAEAVR